MIGLALHPKVIFLSEEANKLLEKVRMYLSVQEEKIVRQSLATRAIPYPNILIKYHKTIDNKGVFPIMLVIPAMNSTAAFYTIGYLGIKIMLYKVKVKYSSFSIVQASDLKEIHEELQVNIYKVKIASVDAVRIYPSIKLSIIKKALILFARKLTAATKKISICAWSSSDLG